MFGGCRAAVNWKVMRSRVTTVMASIIFVTMPPLLRREYRRSLRKALEVTRDRAVAESYLVKTQAEFGASTPSKRREKFRRQQLEDLNTVAHEMGFL
jgi:hypothetical protein